jgi:DNA-binding GntR family transcriptional regulator
MNLIASLSTDAANEDRARAIRDRLHDAIVDHRLAPGTKLNEAEVGALFGVSRTVARAGLQMLAYEGLARIERNRGAFVAQPSPDEARQIFEARRSIEPGIARRACEQLTAEGLKTIAAQLEAEAAFLDRRGPQARRAEIKASGDFHLVLASFAGNPILARFLAELVARSSLVIALYGRSGASSCGHTHHGEILVALKAGEGDEAAHLMLRHLDHIEADLDLRLRGGNSLRDAVAPWEPSVLAQNT